MSLDAILMGLEAPAKAAGMTDPRDVRMLDTSGVKLSADGTVMVPPDFFARARRTKPFLFGLGPNLRGAPRERQDAAKADYLADERQRPARERAARLASLPEANARTMSPAEYQQRKLALIRAAG